ncbi:S41 family peptidase [Aquimarina sp. 2201CG5-10]|uniref:S41 family peptidase n=1 Tax=Aquimarina callyspongiae TaxID=3098150 RepID=UPI002AB57559|nr:S41 family peptidase [Aquimarina sp. 2201CG5-10]MDY8138895.1 S41 family peptidase [Aquimarina sp. 2201CG5-10]
MKLLKYTALLLCSVSLFTSCFNDNDDEPRVSSVLEINNFIYRGMNSFYVYKADVPDLANDRFSSDQEFTDFLNGFSSPEAIFEGLRTQETVTVGSEQIKVDEFSFLVDDYVALEQAFDGITRNNGMEFGLVRYPNNPSNVFGYVRYILPGTDAESKSVQRGDIFNTIDGTQITDQNFSSLLAPDTYTIGLATFDGNDVTATGESVELTKVQYTENPVFIARTLDVGGSPAGYLMYNSFTADFDAQLNNAFAQFKSDGVTNLILDLRYNGGGSVASAIDLSSMITGQFNGEIIITEEWNAEFQQALQNDNPERLINRFDNQIRTGAAINSLNLTKVYILTTRSTASASELVINGLDPYITVVQVGAASRGKFQASVTLYDSSNFARQGANPGHTYAIQPLVFRSLNSVGFTDFFGGFIPEIEVSEDFTNLGTLGDPNEPLLKAAIDDILGNRTSGKYNTLELESVGNSNMFDFTDGRMYHEKEFPAILTEEINF